MSKTKEELAKMSIPELEAHLDSELGKSGKDYLKGVMAVRNQKIRQEELDHWALTEEQYTAAKQRAEAYNCCDRDLHAAQIKLQKAKDDEKSKCQAEVDKLSKQLSETPRISKHNALQDAQRTALKAVRDAQTAVATPASVGVKGK